MNLEQLKQLDIIARQGTLSSASKILHTSQSALSRSMQRLEAALGQELFSRSKNSVELNEAGLIVVDHARAMLREERFMRDALDRLTQRESTLLVGAVAPAPVWRLTSLAVERFPGTIISPITLDEGEVIHRFVNRDIDLAITREPLDIPTSRDVRFMDEHLSVLMPANHPLASQASVTFPQIDGERFLVDSSAGFWLDVVRRRMPHTKFIEHKLGLKVNATKTKIVPPNDLTYLGFGFVRMKDGWHARPSDTAKERFTSKLKYLCRRNLSVDNGYRISKLNEVVRGWVNYFRIGMMKKFLTSVSGWLLTKLRVIIWKQWKVRSRRVEALRQLGVPEWAVQKEVGIGNRYWKAAHLPYVKKAISKDRLTRLKGLVDPLDYYLKTA